MNLPTLAAAALVSGIFAGGATVSSAATITFDDGAVIGNTYEENGFRFSPAGLKNGDCPASSCLLLNNGLLSSVEMRSVSSALFNLLELTFQFVGDTKWQRGTLSVSDVVDQTFTQAEFGNDPFTIPFGTEFANVPRIVFSFSGQGSARLDNVVAEGVTAVPLPDTLPLLIGALGGLGFLTFRRRGLVSPDRPQ